MHIAAGEFEGIEIYDNPDRGLLTTRELTVKEEVFTIIGSSRIIDSEVADINDFSGVYGIEAISRGAKNCVFVGNNKKSNEIIEKNLNRVGLAPELHLYQKSAKDFIYNLGDHDIYQVIFFEIRLPEEVELVEKLVNHLEPEGLIILTIPVISGFTIPKKIAGASVQETRDCEQKTVLVIGKNRES